MNWPISRRFVSSRQIRSILRLCVWISSTFESETYWYCGQLKLSQRWVFFECARFLVYFVVLYVFMWTNSMRAFPSWCWATVFCVPYFRVRLHMTMFCFTPISMECYLSLFSSNVTFSPSPSVFCCLWASDSLEVVDRWDEFQKNNVYHRWRSMRHFIDDSAFVIDIGVHRCR